MKKLAKRSASVACALFLSVGVFVVAQEDLGSWMDDLIGDVNFGYDSTKSIWVENISTDSIEIGSDVVEGELGEQIELYVAMYSEYSILSLLDDSSKLGDVEEEEFDIGSNGGDDTFTIELNADDNNIDPDAVYYISLIPKDDFGFPGDLSNEICFLLSEKLYGEGDECESLGDGSSSSDEDTHSAAGPDMELANITPLQDGDQVTLKWISLDGADEIDIYHWDEDDESFEKLATVDMDDESFQFTISRYGEHTMNFIPLLDGNPVGQEKRFTFNTIDPGTDPNPNPNPPVIDEVPIVGPKENIALILLITVLGYFVYRRVKAKN